MRHPPWWGGIEFHRVLAAGLSLALTWALMILAGAIDSPAGATTLIISLGIITTPFRLLIIEVARPLDGPPGCRG